MALLRSIRHPLRRLAQVDRRRRALVVEAVMWLALARLALVVLPFQTLARNIGTFTPPGQGRAAGRPAPEAIVLAGEIGWAVTRAARYLPLGAVCLPQAMAARLMLKRRGIASVLHFGAIGGGSVYQAINAHAWLDAAGVEVTGYPLAKQCTEIACFV